MKKIILTTITALAAFIMIATSAGCSTKTSKDGGGPVEKEPVVLMVSAAASMTDAMEDIEKAYEQATLGVDVVLNFGSSGSLQKQIEQGAPVDVFLSASKDKMTPLLEEGLLLDDTILELLENEIVLIAPKSSDLSGFDQLTDDSIVHFAMGEPESVPAGKYAKEVLESLELYDMLSEKTVMAKDVREVLSWVETGNVEAGMVYHTDAILSDSIEVIAEAPEGSHSPIVYPAAIIKDSKNPDLAADFIVFLSSKEMKLIFMEYGFKVK